VIRRLYVLWSCSIEMARERPRLWKVPRLLNEYSYPSSVSMPQRRATPGARAPVSPSSVQSLMSMAEQQGTG